MDGQLGPTRLLDTLDLDRLTAVYPGDGAWSLTERIRVAGLGALTEEMAGCSRSGS